MAGEMSDFFALILNPNIWAVSAYRFGRAHDWFLCPGYQRISPAATWIFQAVLSNRGHRRRYRHYPGGPEWAQSGAAYGEIQPMKMAAAEAPGTAKIRLFSL
jgi:hypothetical protein